MSAAIEQSVSKTPVGSGRRAPLPQVNLLPPEVRSARGLMVVKRWLGVSLIATLALCAVAYAGALVSASMAEKDLTAEQRVTSELQLEEQKYAEVPQVLTALALTELARESGMSTEVQWKGYLDAITAVLPDGVSIESFSVSPASTADPADSTNPLKAASVGEIQFTGRTATIPDAAAWVDSLNSIPGITGAWVSSATVAANESSVYYTVAGSVQYTEVAYAHRFSADEGTN